MSLVKLDAADDAVAALLSGVAETFAETDQLIAVLKQELADVGAELDGCLKALPAIFRLADVGADTNVLVAGGLSPE